MDVWLQACTFDIVLPQDTHNHRKKHAKNISHEIYLDKELQGSKSDVLEYLVSLVQVENARICIQILVSIS